MLNVKYLTLGSVRFFPCVSEGKIKQNNWKRLILVRKKNKSASFFSKVPDSLAKNYGIGHTLFV